MAGNNSEAEDEADNNDNVLVDEDAVSVFISRPALERGLDAVEAATNYHPESFGEAFAGMTLDEVVYGDPANGGGIIGVNARPAE